MGRLLEKAILVADGCNTSTPSSIPYSSVVTRESARVVFLLTSLNDLEIYACDILNEYRNANLCENIWTEYCS